MIVTDITKTEVFYITTETGGKYKRVAHPITMDRDTWYVITQDGDFIVKDEKLKNVLKEACLDYVERSFTGCF